RRAEHEGDAVKPLDCVIVPTGVANRASVLAGLAAAGAAPRVARDASDLRDAEAVVLPGVGSFDAGVAALALGGLDAALRERIAEGRPTLAVCLGMQLLLDGSDESRRGAAGLGVVRGRAQRFAGGVRVPQIGWNAVQAEPGCSLLESGVAYFANSFRLVERPAGFGVASAEHGGRFVAALERGAL